MRQSQIPRHAGFTLIELLVTMAVAVIIAVVAVPSMQNMVIKKNLSNASEKVAVAFRKARLMARSQNTQITVQLSQGSNTVQLTAPNGDVVQSIQLDGVSADTDLSIQFNSLGTVNTTGSINLVSTKDSNKSTPVSIDNLFGHITTG